MATAYINNQPFEFEPGESMLSFIKRHKGEKSVPTLCDSPHLDPYGACRVCSVDVALEQNGPTRSQASFHTPVTVGQYIYPDSQNLQDLR